MDELYGVLGQEARRVRQGEGGGGRHSSTHLLWPPLFDFLPGPAVNGPGAGGDVCAHWGHSQTYMMSQRHIGV